MLTNLSTIIPARIACATLLNLGLSDGRRLMVDIDRVKVMANQSRTSLGTESGSISDNTPSSSSINRLETRIKSISFLLSLNASTKKNNSNLFSMRNFIIDSTIVRDNFFSFPTNRARSVKSLYLFDFENEWRSADENYRDDCCFSNNAQLSRIFSSDELPRFILMSSFQHIGNIIQIPYKIFFTYENIAM